MPSNNSSNVPVGKNGSCQKTEHTTNKNVCGGKNKSEKDQKKPFLKAKPTIDIGGKKYRLAYVKKMIAQGRLLKNQFLHSKLAVSQSNAKFSGSRGQFSHSKPQSFHPKPQFSHPERQFSYSQPEFFHPERQFSHPQPQFFHPERQSFHSERKSSHSKPHFFHSEKQSFHPENQFYHSKRQFSHSKQFLHPETQFCHSMPTTKLKFNKVKKAVEVCLSSFQENQKDKLIDDAEPIYLQVLCVKMPDTRGRSKRLFLPHSGLKAPDVCLIVPDDYLKGKPVPPEKTVERVRDLLRSQNVTRITGIITTKQLATDYKQFEMKRKLCDSYDIFLSNDTQDPSKMYSLLGKRFKKTNKVPQLISSLEGNLNSKLDSFLSKTVMNIRQGQETFTCEIGNTSQPSKHLVENIMSIGDQLDEKFPGGFRNIRSLTIKTQDSLLFPVYYSELCSSSVETPVDKPKRPKAHVPVTRKLSTKGKEVTVLPDGTVLVNKKQAKGEDNDEDNDDDSSSPVVRKDNKQTKNNKWKGNKVENEVVDEGEDDDEEELLESGDSDSDENGMSVEKAEKAFLESLVEPSSSDGEEEEEEEADNDDDDDDDDNEDEENQIPTSAKKQKKNQFQAGNKQKSPKGKVDKTTTPNSKTQKQGKNWQQSGSPKGKRDSFSGSPENHTTPNNKIQTWAVKKPQQNGQEKKKSKGTKKISRSEKRGKLKVVKSNKTGGKK